jgi:hypothetical protein
MAAFSSLSSSGAADEVSVENKSDCGWGEEAIPSVVSWGFSCPSFSLRFVLIREIRVSLNSADLSIPEEGGGAQRFDKK